ncbi:hypothetical protein F7734_53540 [Scytonema sp. UIC 10036]|uniref:hypothetical protein n=1 Tax=Scytonema sp. UIC 10036 TaxID=2304196 RepID=UPI0012DA09DE|nr:hypothetical protein [Scytonema sp. UIC 10036]MUH00632.1 hypothetical protein [Scytonema sp. UIC 10036]
MSRLYHCPSSHPSPHKTCTACGCDRVNFIHLQPPSPHFGCYRCAECDRFRGWTEKSANREKREQLQRALAQLLESSSLTSWEKNFLLGIQNQRKLSPKQLEKLQSIFALKGGR